MSRRGGFPRTRGIIIPRTMSDVSGTLRRVQAETFHPQIQPLASTLRAMRSLIFHNRLETLAVTRISALRRWHYHCATHNYVEKGFQVEKCKPDKGIKFIILWEILRKDSGQGVVDHVDHSMNDPIYGDHGIIKVPISNPSRQRRVRK